MEQRDETIAELNKPIPITMANIDRQIELNEAGLGGSTFMTDVRMGMSVQ